MKICIVHYLYNHQGGRVWVAECAKALGALGHEVSVVDMDPLPSPTDAQRAGSGLRRRLARYLHEPSYLAKNLTAFLTERRIMRGQQPDVVIVRHKLFRFSALLAAKSLKRPVILWVHGPGAYSYRHYEPRFFHVPWVAEGVERFTWQLADAIITVSEQLKALLVAQGIVPDRITPIPNGVDPERFAPSGDGVAIRDRYGLRDRTIIGFSGTLAPWHGVDHLVGLVRDLLPRYREATLLLVGDGQMTTELFRAAERAGVRGQVIVTGRVPHDAMPEYLAAMDIAIAPYGTTVPFYHSPLKLFEYLAMGKPVVAARIGQIPEVIDDGKNGLLYDPADGQGLIEQVVRLIGDAPLRRALGTEARQAVQRYSWAQAAKTVEAVVVKLVARDLARSHGDRS